MTSIAIGESQSFNERETQTYLSQVEERIAFSAKSVQLQSSFTDSILEENQRILDIKSANGFVYWINESGKQCRQDLQEIKVTVP
jgi:hypothetical protein